MSQPSYDLFDNEERIIEASQALSERLSITLDEAQSGFNQLVEAYRKSCREQRRLVKVSDRLQAQLDTARQQAESANKAKSLFLATMTHEIRNPLSAMIGVVDLLLNTPLNADQKELAGLMRIGSHSLFNIINDILDFSKIEAGKLVLEDDYFSPRKLLDEVVSLMATQARQKGLDCRLLVADEVPQQVRGDPARLRQIVLNLLGNAIKFTREGAVTVQVHCLRQDDNHAELRYEIKDTGIGLSEEQQTHLFTFYSQADPSIARRYGGTGLGLAICKNLVQAMSGELGVDSVPGSGSTFWFTARFGLVQNTLSTVVAAVAPPQAEQAHDLARGMTGRALDLRIADHGERLLNTMRVLVLDDNISNATLLQSHLSGLENVGCQVLTDPYKALDWCAQNTADLVLVDVLMPGMDGFEFLAELQRLPAYANVPVVMITASIDPSLRQRALVAGVTDFIRKPADPVELLARVRNMLRLRQRQLELEHEINQRQQLEAELRHMVSTDELTGLYSRRYFLEAADRESKRSRRTEQPLTVLVMDIDHFKQINDQFGHAGGDYALRQFSGIARQMLRETDLIGRLGGEEFGALLPETDGAGALEVAERIRAAVAAANLDIDGRAFTLTVSIGVALYKPAHYDIETTLLQADRALYQAKHAGRNCVKLAG